MKIKKLLLMASISSGLSLINNLSAAAAKQKNLSSAEIENQIICVREEKRCSEKLAHSLTKKLCRNFCNKNQAIEQLMPIPLDSLKINQEIEQEQKSVNEKFELEVVLSSDNLTQAAISLDIAAQVKTTERPQTLKAQTTVTRPKILLAKLNQVKNDLTQKTALLTKEIEELTIQLDANKAREARERQLKEEEARQKALAAKKAQEEEQKKQLIDSSPEVSATATAYSYQAPGMGTRGSFGVNLIEHPDQIAADPKFLPPGSLVYIVELSKEFLVGDTGSAIKGKHIDIHFSTNSQALAWGRRSITLRVLRRGL